MNKFANNLSHAFGATVTGVEQFCDMLKELSAPLAAVIWAAVAFIPLVWCLAIAKHFGAF